MEKIKSLDTTANSTPTLDNIPENSGNTSAMLNNSMQRKRICAKKWENDDVSKESDDSPITTMEVEVEDTQSYDIDKDPNIPIPKQWVPNTFHRSSWEDTVVKMNNLVKMGKYEENPLYQRYDKESWDQNLRGPFK